MMEAFFFKKSSRTKWFMRKDLKKLCADFLMVSSPNLGLSLGILNLDLPAKIMFHCVSNHYY